MPNPLDSYSGKFSGGRVDVSRCPSRITKQTSFDRTCGQVEVHTVNHNLLDLRLSHRSTLEAIHEYNQRQSERGQPATGCIWSSNIPVPISGEYITWIKLQLTQRQVIRVSPENEVIQG